MFFFFFSIDLYKNKYFYYRKLFFCFEKVTNQHFIYPIILQFMWIYYSFIIFFTIDVEKRYRIINNFEIWIAL